MDEVSALPGSENDLMLWGVPSRSHRLTIAEPSCKSWCREVVMPIQVILADDHQIVRQGLKVLLEREGFKIVGEASNGQEAVQLAQKFQPDVAVLDLAMPILNGLDAAREIQRVSPKTKTILLTMHTESHYIFEGLQLGA